MLFLYRSLTITACLAFHLPLSAQEKKPVIEKIDEHNYTVGDVKLNKETQEIAFAAVLCHPDSIIEYLLVNEHGKIHEALLITQVRPSHLNIAMKLLGYKESKELFKVLDSQRIPTQQYHQESKAVKKAARFDVLIQWQDDGKQHSHHINELIYNNVTKKHALIQPYIYNGSYLTRGNFEADMTGDIIAILTNRAAMANFSNKGREDDTIWQPNPKYIPKPETPLTIIFKKHQPLVSQ